MSRFVTSPLEAILVQWPDLPYEVIGKWTVVVVALSLLAVLILLAVVCLLFIWFRGWDLLTRLLWYGSARNPNRLPTWRLEASIYAQAIKNFDPSLVPELREDLGQDDSDETDDANIEKESPDQ